MQTTVNRPALIRFLVYLVVTVYRVSAASCNNTRISSDNAGISCDNHDISRRVLKFKCFHFRCSHDRRRSMQTTVNRPALIRFLVYLVVTVYRVSAASCNNTRISSDNAGISCDNQGISCDNQGISNITCTRNETNVTVCCYGYNTTDRSCLSESGNGTTLVGDNCTDACFCPNNTYPIIHDLVVKNVSCGNMSELNCSDGNGTTLVGENFTDACFCPNNTYPIIHDLAVKNVSCGNMSELNCSDAVRNDSRMCIFMPVTCIVDHVNGSCDSENGFYLCPLTCNEAVGNDFRAVAWIVGHVNGSCDSSVNEFSLCQLACNETSGNGTSKEYKLSEVTCSVGNLSMNMSNDVMDESDICLLACDAIKNMSFPNNTFVVRPPFQCNNSLNGSCVCRPGWKLYHCNVACQHSEGNQANGCGNYPLTGNCTENMTGDCECNVTDKGNDNQQNVTVTYDLNKQLLTSVLLGGTSSLVVVMVIGCIVCLMRWKRTRALKKSKLMCDNQSTASSREKRWSDRYSEIIENPVYTSLSDEDISKLRQTLVENNQREIVIGDGTIMDEAAVTIRTETARPAGTNGYSFCSLDQVVVDDANTVTQETSEDLSWVKDDNRHYRSDDNQSTAITHEKRWSDRYSDIVENPVYTSMSDEDISKVRQTIVENNQREATSSDDTSIKTVRPACANVYSFCRLDNSVGDEANTVAQETSEELSCVEDDNNDPSFCGTCVFNSMNDKSNDDSNSDASQCNDESKSEHRSLESAAVYEIIDEDVKLLNPNRADRMSSRKVSVKSTSTPDSVNKPLVTINDNDDDVYNTLSEDHTTKNSPKNVYDTFASVRKESVKSTKHVTGVGSDSDNEYDIVDRDTEAGKSMLYSDVADTLVTQKQGTGYDNVDRKPNADKDMLYSEVADTLFPQKQYPAAASAADVDAVYEDCGAETVPVTVLPNVDLKGNAARKRGSTFAERLDIGADHEVITGQTTKDTHCSGNPGESLSERSPNLSPRDRISWAGSSDRSPNLSTRDRMSCTESASCYKSYVSGIAEDVYDECGNIARLPNLGGSSDRISRTGSNDDGGSKPDISEDLYDDCINTTNKNKADANQFKTMPVSEDTAEEVYEELDSQVIANNNTEIAKSGEPPNKEVPKNLETGKKKSKKKKRTTARRKQDYEEFDFSFR